MSKQCWIKVRYQIKRTGTICVRIENEQGIEYTTCKHQDGRTTCTCEAGSRGRQCYHAKHLLATEAQRQAQADEMSSQPVNLSNMSNASETQIEGLVSSMGNDTPTPLQGHLSPVSEAQHSPAVVSIESRLTKMGFMAGSHRGGKLAGLV
jgi:hypothetical protein